MSDEEGRRGGAEVIPADRSEARVPLDGREVRVTNLDKPFWPENRVKDRPPGRVLVDYNQNAWGRTLASVYSVRPRAGAPVSTPPVTWEEVEGGVETEDFRLPDVPERAARLGDLWRPAAWPRRGRFDLERILAEGLGAASPGST